MRSSLAFPVEDPDEIKALRAAWNANPEDHEVQLSCGLTLAKAGHGYEAARLLRPLRKLWKDSDDAACAQAALDAQSWWNKHWKEFARTSQHGRQDEALQMLGDRASQFWDFPPLQMHLVRFAVEREDYDLAEHLARRIHFLSRRGVPKINMAAFEYGAQEYLIEILWRRGDPKAALDQHRGLAANPGNAMAFEIQRARLLVAVGEIDIAMDHVAAMLKTARTERKGYSRDVRLEFVDTSTDLDALRENPDWDAMYEDPAGWLKSRAR